jgi:thiamine kinase-like enzyme
MQHSELAQIIPGAKLEAVREALFQTFGVDVPDGIQLIAGGLSSALVFKVIIKNKPYVLRIITNINPLSEPTRQFACMSIAAAAGIAPKILYAEPDAALSITEFVESIPLTEHFQSRQELLGAIVNTIRSIHNLAPFPKLVEFLDGVDIFIGQYKATGILPQEVLKEHFAYYAEIQKIYPRHDPDMVSSHNDLNPNNILCDGKKLWIIDWETAFLNDRFVDLAIVADFFSVTEREERPFLEAYFDGNLDEYKCSRFFLMRQVCLMYYATIVLRLAAAQKPGQAIDISMDVPSIEEVKIKTKDGALSRSTYDGQLLYGKALLNEMLRQMKTERFVDSLKQLQ